MKVEPFSIETFGRTLEEFSNIALTIDRMLRGRVVIMQSKEYYSNSSNKGKVVNRIVKINDILYGYEKGSPMLLLLDENDQRLLLVTNDDDCEVRFKNSPVNNLEFRNKDSEYADRINVCTFTFGEG